jgi:hypothetical protein
MDQSYNGMNAEAKVIAEALEAIRAAVRRNAGYVSAGDVPPITKSTALTELAELAVISPHLPITWNTPVVGRFVALSKRATRLLLRWYINPIVEQQNGFNDALVRIIASLEGRVRDIERSQALSERER